MIALARRSRLLQRLIACRAGVSAVEFALILPVMLMLYLGGVEVTQGIAIDRKSTLVARSVSDLVAQSTCISDINTIFDASKSVLAPYDTTNISLLRVTQVAIDNNNSPSVNWSKVKTGAARADVTGLPDALKVPGYVIWAETEYDYKPVVGYLIKNNIKLKNQVFMRPRSGSAVKATCT